MVQYGTVNFWFPSEADMPQGTGSKRWEFPQEGTPDNTQQYVNRWPTKSTLGQLWYKRQKMKMAEDERKIPQNYNTA